MPSQKNSEFLDRMVAAVNSDPPKKRGPYKKAGDKVLARRRVYRMIKKYGKGAPSGSMSIYHDVKDINSHRQYLKAMRNIYRPLLKKFDVQVGYKRGKKP